VASEGEGEEEKDDPRGDDDGESIHECNVADGTFGGGILGADGFTADGEPITDLLRFRHHWHDLFSLQTQVRADGA
jgi:hypothetical protein